MAGRNDPAQTASEPAIGQLFDLSGRIVLITGATGHLGSAMARALAEAGASVAVGSRDMGKARAFAASLPNVERGKHFGVAIDHMEPASLEAGFAEAAGQAGAVDAVINNGHEGIAADWRSVTPEQFNRQLQNLTGYFLLARLLRDHVAKRRAPGVVVMVGSMYGVVGSYPDAYEGVTNASPAAYHALKGGVVHLTRHLAAYWAKDGVRVNCLSPGPFPSSAANPQMVRRLEGKVPMGRMGRPDELKGAIVFLTSDASSYMTGQNLLIDGGWTAW